MPGGDLLVQTVDLIAPIVRDPAMFGKVACANSLSDVYAMGGRPIAAMNVVGFPSKRLDVSVLRMVIDGALETLAEAQCPLVGGHTVDDDEFKFGFSVSGVIEGGEILSIDKAQVGDVLVMTKPLGTGVVNRALRKDAIDDRSPVYVEAQRSMITLNAGGAKAARAARAHAATDVTGFGFLGHATQFARASQVTFEIDRTSIPVFEGVRDLIAKGLAAGRAKDNGSAYGARVRGLQSDEEAAILFDPQTSGGLLVSLPPDQADAFKHAMGDWPLGVSIVGRVGAKSEHDVVLR
jgi:selenide,water dikinase